MNITANMKIKIEDTSDASTLIASEVMESDNYRDNSLNTQQLQMPMQSYTPDILQT